MSEIEERYIVPGLDRGLRLLQLFSPERPHWTLSELARALGLSRSSVFRLVYTLEAGGFLRREGEKTVRLGAAVLGLGFAFLASQDVAEAARPFLEALRDATGASAHLSVLDGDRVLYLLRAPSRLALISNIAVGARLPAATTTMGRVLTCELDEAALRALAPHGEWPDAATRAADRARGHVAAASRYERGIVSLAAPVRDESGRIVAAINLSAPEAQLPLPRAEADGMARLLEAAAAISRSLGWRG